MILFTSRPLLPPWDEGTKNMLSEIVKTNENLRYFGGGKNSIGVYRGNKIGFLNKIRLLGFLLTGNTMDFSKIVFCYYPTFLNTIIPYFVLKIKRFEGEIIQFLPSFPNKMFLLSKKYIVISEYTKKMILSKNKNAKIYLINPFVK